MSSKGKGQERYWARFVPSWKKPEPIKPVIRGYTRKDPCLDCTWPSDVCKQCPFK